MQVDPVFLDLINYGTCRVLSERLVKEATEDIFREVGRVCYWRAKEKGLIGWRKTPSIL